jgi:hypothetical protein
MDERGAECTETGDLMNEWMQREERTRSVGSGDDGGEALERLAQRPVVTEHSCSLPCWHDGDGNEVASRRWSSTRRMVGQVK